MYTFSDTFSFQKLSSKDKRSESRSTLIFIFLVKTQEAILRLSHFTIFPFFLFLDTIVKGQEEREQEALEEDRKRQEAAEEMIRQAAMEDEVKKKAEEEERLRKEEEKKREVIALEEEKKRLVSFFVTIFGHFQLYWAVFDDFRPF